MKGRQVERSPKVRHYEAALQFAASSQCQVETVSFTILNYCASLYSLYATKYAVTRCNILRLKRIKNTLAGIWEMGSGEEWTGLGTGKEKGGKKDEKGKGESGKVR